MAVTSIPNVPVLVTREPIAVESGLVDANSSTDLITFSRAGAVDIAFNSGQNSWREFKSFDLGIGAINGAISGLISADGFVDLVAINSQVAQIFINDRLGGFVKGQAIHAPVNSAWSGNSSAMLVHLNQDTWNDLALLDQANRQLYVWFGTASGAYEIGGNQQVAGASFSVKFDAGFTPTALASGRLIGDAYQDIAVGMANGKIVFLEGQADGSWTINTNATITQSSPIQSLAVADLNTDGSQDLAVSTSNDAFVLLQSPAILPRSPIANGDFTQGLSSWQVAATTPSGTPSTTIEYSKGQVNAVGGKAQLDERQSFLTSLSQQFTIPPNPQTISIDINALGLQSSVGEIPDAFEVSLLNQQGLSLLPTHRAQASSLFNAIRTADGSLVVRSGTDTMFDGTKLTIDISSVPAGTEANLIFDLVGNPSSSNSSVTLDNVVVSPTTIASYAFTKVPLSGPFESPGQIRTGDVNGDQRTDIVLVDGPANKILVFNGTDSSTWPRSELEPGSLGTGPTSLVLANLNDDASIDIGYTVTSPARLLTPIGASGICLPWIDFEIDSSGNHIQSGSRSRDLFSQWGLTFAANPNLSPQPIIADWSRVDPQSPDASSVGNVVFLAKLRSGADDDDHDDDDHDDDDHDDDDHDDDDENEKDLQSSSTKDGYDTSHNPNMWAPRAGTLTLNFQQPTEVDDLTLLGIRLGQSATIRLFDSSGNVVQTRTINGNSSGTKQSIEVDANNVSKLSIDLPDGGALADLTFCRTLLPGNSISIAGPSTTDEGSLAILDLRSPLVTVDQWLINWGDGQIERPTTDATSLQHTYTDGAATKSIFATAKDSRGNIYLANRLSINIANVPPTLLVTGASAVDSGLLYSLGLSSTDPGVDRIATWTIDWGDGTQSVSTLPQANMFHSYRNLSNEDTTYTITVTARDEDNPTGTPYTATPREVIVHPDTSRTFPTIDFERDAAGTKLRAGDRITNQFSGLGISIAAYLASKPTVAQPAIVIDTAYPANGAKDLGTPNSAFGGPGHGTGGSVGKPGENKQALNNALIIPRYSSSTSPEDNEGGGTLRFAFADPVQLDEVQLLDIDRNGSVLRLYNAQSQLIREISIPNRGTNSFQTLAIDSSQVSRMDIVLTGGGALAAVVSRRHSPTIVRPETRYFVVDSNDRTYRYSAPGADLGEFPINPSLNARGITTWLTANPVWIISEQGLHDRIAIVDTTTEQSLGSWSISNSNLLVEGIATDGKDIWVVDDLSNRVYRFADGASRRSGSASASDSFALARTNTSPKDIVTDGKLIWVVDSAVDRVFVYNRRGLLVNQWLLDSRNSDATGIAINPRTNDGIYVLDGVDKRVYTYTKRTSPSVMRQAASSSFALARSNSNPTGLVDPGGQTTIGAIVSSSLASAGAVDEWIFNATAGQSIYVNFQAISDTLQAELFAPNGQTVYSKSSFRPSGLDSGTLQLNSSGIYRLRLTASTVVDYQFQIFDIPAPDTNPITFGQVHAGALNSPGRIDQWTFNGNANQRFSLDFLSLETVVGGDLIADIVSPSGQLVSTRISILPNSLDQTFTLTETGQHSLMLRAGFDGSQLPSYSFQMFSVPADDIRDLSFRTVAAGAIEVPGARDQWKFHGERDQNIFIDMQQLTGGDLQVQILKPDGSLLNSRTFSLASGLDQELILPVTGTYTIALDGAGSANLNTYSFVIWDIPDEVVEHTTINTTLFGSTVPGQSVPFDFQGEAGTPILLDIIQSANGSVGITLLQPDGQVLVERATTNQLLTLTQTGTYQAIVGSSSNVFIDGAGPYRFRIQNARSPTVGSRDSLGTRFVLAFPPNLREPFAANNPSFSLTIASAVDTSGTVQVPGLGFSTSFTVQAGITTKVPLPSQVELSTSDAIVDRAIVVTALNEVAVFGLDQLSLLTEGFTALPVDALGNDYYVMAYPNTANIVTDGGSSLTIAATQSTTQVTITPSTTVGSHPAGIPFTISLSNGQAYTLHAFGPLGADLTGTRITSSAPIAVLGGNTAALVPAGKSAANHLVEQLTPTDTWGSRFVTVPLATRTGGDTFRFLARQNNTQVRIDGLLAATLQAGGVFERVLTSASLIESSAPLLVAQYSNGSTFDNSTADPFMMLVAPAEQFLQDYILSTPADGFAINYANLVVPSSAAATVTRNGTSIPASAFTPVGTSGYSFAQIPISVGSHRFRASAALGVSIYGYANFDAYGYFGGMQVGPIAQVSNLTLSPPTVSLPLNAQHVLTAAVSDSAGRPLAAIRVDFVVSDSSGNTVSRSSIFTDATGRANLTLTRATAGTLSITATVGGQSQSATATWGTTAPTINIISPTNGTTLPAGKHIINGRVQPGSVGTTISELTINGQRVNSIDAAGYFFAAVDIVDGSQTFAFRATNSSGSQTTRNLTLVGELASSQTFDLRQTIDLTNSVSVQYVSATFNRSLNQLLTEVTLTNNGDLPLDPKVALRFERIDPADVTLSRPDLFTDDKLAVLLLDDDLPADGLQAGQASAPLSIVFDNPNRRRFSVETSVLAQANQAPRFTSTPDFLTSPNRTYRYQAAATDPDSQRLAYQLARGPDGMSIDSRTGLLSWSVPVGINGGQQVAISVSDSRGGTATQSFNLVVQAASINRPPVFTTAPITGALPGSNYRYAAAANDVDGDSLTYSLLNAPTGMTIDNNSGLVTYNSVVAGSYPVNIQVSDSRGGVATQAFTLSVGTAQGVSVPTIISVPPVTAVVGKQYLYTVNATDLQQNVLTFALLSAPSGMSINTGTGRITWQPTLADLGITAVVQIQVRNTQGGQGLQSYSVTVLAAEPNAAPLFTSVPVTVATVGATYFYASVAIDPEGQPLTYSLVSGPAGMRVNDATGRIAWIPAAGDVGLRRVVIAATDPLGQKAFQAFALSTRGPNTPPVFISQPLTQATVGAPYRTDVQAIDTEDEVTYSLIAGPAGMLIDSQGGALTWAPGLVDRGNSNVVVRATDARGLTADQSFTIVTTGDTQPPLVTLTLSQPIADPGQPVTIQVLASDNVLVTSLVLTDENGPLDLDSQGRALVTPSAPGLRRFSATARDASGNTATAKSTLIIRNLSDTAPPTVSIQAPLNGATVTYLTDIVGTVTDEDLVSYTLEYSRVNANSWRLLAERSLIEEIAPIDVNNSLLGVFDPTLVLNDQYEIRLTGTDLNGQTSSTSILVSLDGDAKLGILEVPSTEVCETCDTGDVTIPVAGGPPISIKRQYSTLNTDDAGDFGQGWQFCMAEPNIRETVARSEFENILGQFGGLPFRAGQKIYITAPDCQRIGFTFSPTLHSGVWSEIGSAFYQPRWLPDPGVDWQLYGESDFTRLTGIASGEFDLAGLPLPLVRFADDQYILAAISASYNPEGYQLIGKDGTRYHYSQTEGLLDVTDRNGNRLNRTEGGIQSSSGQGVKFQRDAAGHITKVIDDGGREINYIYNSQGQLERVDYPSGLADTYRYTADHLLAGINGDNQQQAMVTREFEYDLAGRLAVILNAFGYSNTQTFNLEANTQSTFDALGNRTDYRYDDRGNVVFERSPNGDQFTMEYDANDNRTKVIDELGHVTSMEYDARRNLTRFVDALGNVTQFEYNSGNYVTRQIDAQGNVYTYDYDERQNIVGAAGPGGSESVLTYDQQGRLLTFTDTDGRVRKYEYGSQSAPTRLVNRDGTEERFTFNIYGHITESADELGRISRVTYDDGERPTEFIDPLGTSVKLTYNGRSIEELTDEAGFVTRYEYDAEFRPTKLIRADATNGSAKLSRPTDSVSTASVPVGGGVTTMEYDPRGLRTALTDANGNRKTFSYRSDGLLASEIDAAGGVTTFEYDAVGRATAAVDPNGNRWETVYDALGYVIASIDPLGHRTEMTYDLMGNLTSRRDALGRLTSFEYNSIQRPTRIIDPRGGVLTLTYAWDGRLLTETDPAGRTMRYEYDDMNRLVRAIDPTGAVEATEYDDAGNQVAMIDKRGARTLLRYDAKDRLVETEDPIGAITKVEYDQRGLVIRMIDATGAERTYEYDSVGRVVTSVDQLGAQSNVSYDAMGNVVSSRDALGRVNRYAYDSLNRLVVHTDPLGEQTRYGYDAVGNLTSYRDPLGNTTRFGYDRAYRWTSTTDALGNRSTQEYDSVSNISATVDREGRRTAYGYDVLDRLTSESWLSNGVPINAVTYTYDAVGNLLVAQDAFSRLSHSYDVLNRMLTSDNQGTPGAPRVVLSFTYDANDNRTSVTDSANVSIQSTYDSRNLLTSRTWGGGGVSAARVDWTYDVRGLPQTMRRSGSLTGSSSIVSVTTEHFDPKGRLDSIVHANSTGQALVSYAYERNEADQLTSETHHGQVRTYTRDNFGQLTSASINGVATESFAYDQNGNRIGNGEVVGADNRLTENATHRFAYDREGNLIRKTNKTTGEVEAFTYDHRQRLVVGTRTSSSGVLLSRVVNRYDVFNRRIARSEDPDGAGPQTATTTHTVYDGENAWADYNAAGQLVTRYMFGDGPDQILARWRPAEGTVWYLTDHLGSVRDMLNAQGVVINTLDYDSFGRIASQTNAAVSDRFTYTGREWDPTLQLYYYRSRFYDPTSGRFTSQDRVGFAAGDANLYRYVGNSPLDYTDPSGDTALLECSFVRSMQTYVAVTCSVLEMAFKKDLLSTDIDKQVQNVFTAMSIAFNVLPFGSSVVLQSTMRAITIVQTAQALASLNINEHLFTLLEIAEVFVVQAIEIYEQGAAATFQDALAAFARSDNKRLLITRLLCAAANMGLMVLSAHARCFVAGTPVLVGVLPPEKGDVDEQQLAWSTEVINVTAGLAVCLLLWPRRGASLLPAVPPLVGARDLRKRVRAKVVDEFMLELAAEPC